jgi:Arc/MetJ-type ribon-helix-helix transcriptional regulator
MITEKLPHKVSVGFTDQDIEAIDRMVREGDFVSRSALIRSLVRAIIDDDAAAEAAE